MTEPSPRWLVAARRKPGALYLAIVEALEEAIASGELQPGERLPPHRRAAAALGIDFTTVSRAYAEARARGLVDGAVGRGTFVRGRPGDDEAGAVDLSMNLPPPPDGAPLGELLGRTTAAILRRSDPAVLMAYHPGAGALGQRLAGAAWLAPVLGAAPPPERVLVAAGAQTALAATLATLCRPGDVVLAEPLGYPGFRDLAQQSGLRLTPCPTDGEGVIPDAFERLCRQLRPTALYLTPTLQNPTGATLPLDRRRAIAAIAEAQGVWLIEDDPYWKLLDAPLPALAALAPQRTVHIATLSKCISPGLRTAFVAAPESLAEVLAERLRALSLMPAPLMAAVVGAWIREGQAEALVAGVRREARARRALAAIHLPQATGAAEAIHVWLPLTAAADAAALRGAAQERGLALVTAEAFAVAPGHAQGVRISLGGAARRPVLTAALEAIAGLVDTPPTPRKVV